MRRKHIWALISIAAMLVAIGWAYWLNVWQGQRVVIITYIEMMLKDLEWIDYTAVFYEDLKKENLLDGTALASRVQSKLDKTFKEKKATIGMGKDSILNKTGNSKYKRYVKRDDLLDKKIEDWIKDNKLNVFQKLDVTTSFFGEKYADKDLSEFVATAEHFSDFYQLRDYLENVKNDQSVGQLSIFDLIRTYLLMIISILSIVSWFYGVIHE